MANYLKIFTLLAYFCFQTWSLTYPLSPSRPRCFKDYLSVGRFVIGNYVVQDHARMGKDYTLSLLIYNPEGGLQQGMPKQLEVFSGQFNHLARSDGWYRICIQAQINPSSRLKAINLVLTMQSEEDRFHGEQNDLKFAQKDDFSPIQNSLNKMKRGAHEILANMKSEMKREAIYMKAQRNMSSRVGWLVFFQIVIVLAVAIGSVLVLRSYFVKKNIQ